MKNTSPTHFSRRTVLLAMTGALAELTACGGGGTSLAGLTSGGTGSFTAGTITGLGSIIVNGIRYNDDTATKLNADDDSDTRTALELGMVVSIEGSAVTPAATATGLPTATATRITYGSEWKGPVSNISTVNPGFEILGLRVDVLDSTVFAGAALVLGSLTDAHYVEVHGYVNRDNGHIQASRIEVSTSQPAVYKLSGALTQLNRDARTATLGSMALGWAADVEVPTGLVDGVFVRVRLNALPQGSVWTVNRFSLPKSPVASLKSDHAYEAEIHGRITAYTSPTNFTVNDISINAGEAQIEGTLALGVYVEVKGSINAGQMVAMQVEVKSAAEIESNEFEFIGQISNATAQTFELRGTTFDYDLNTELKGITVLQGSSARAEVKARRSDSGGYYATRVQRAD